MGPGPKAVIDSSRGLIAVRNVLVENPVPACWQAIVCRRMLAEFCGVFILGCFNSHPVANLGCKSLPGGISAQNIPHGPVYPAGFAV